jgi:hypothetical protein
VERHLAGKPISVCRRVRTRDRLKETSPSTVFECPVVDRWVAAVSRLPRAFDQFERIGSAPTGQPGTHMALSRGCRWGDGCTARSAAERRDDVYRSRRLYERLTR